MEVTRNEPCPCGSGLKAKRCCLDRMRSLQTIAAKLEPASVEALLTELGPDASRALRSAFSDVFLGGENLGAALVVEPWQWVESSLLAISRERLGLEWLLRGAQTDSVAELLATVTVRAWRLVGSPRAGMVEAQCAVGGGKVELELAGPAGDGLVPDRLLVGHTIPRPEGRFALLGRPAAVAEEARADLEELLARSVRSGGDPDELGRRLGGELLAAAWCWPEERVHTREGDLVREAHVAFRPPRFDRARVALEEWPATVPVDKQYEFEDVLAFDLRLEPGLPSAQPPNELGVRWELCVEDQADPPALARIEINGDEGELWLFAPTRGRLDVAEPELVSRLGGLLGPEVHRGLDRSDVQRRWQRDRLQATLADLDLDTRDEA